MKDYWDSSAVIEACNSPALRVRLHRAQAESILDKERRIADIMGQIKGLLARRT